MQKTLNLHIVRNDVSHDARVLRITGSLVSSGYFEQVHVAGLHDGRGPDELDVEGRKIWRISLRTRNLPRSLPFQAIKLREWRWHIFRRFTNVRLGVIHCHDLIPLSIAARLKRLTGARLIYDAHELETEMRGLAGTRKLLAKEHERRLIGHVDAMITVSPSIQDWYRRAFPDTRVELVRNVPETGTEITDPVPLRARFGVADAELLFIFTGGVSWDRGIELILDAFAHPDVAHHVVFLGDGALRPSVEEAAMRHPNIHWLPPVPPCEVVPQAAGADVGISLIEDVSLSYRYCLPNKLFESLAAGLPVLVSNLPDQAALVRSVEGGWIIEPTREALTAVLRDLTPDRVRAVAAGLPERTRHLTWENESKVLIDLYRDLLSS